MVLGETDPEVMRQAFFMGYDAFESNSPSDFLDESEVERYQEDDDTYLSDFENVRVAISESSECRKLWRELETYYEVEKSEEEEKRFKVEAAVAEDFDVAFNAGAMSAISGDSRDPEDHIEHLM